MPILRRFLKRSLPILGGVWLLYSALVIEIGTYQLVMFGLGFLIIFVGTWQLYSPLLPSQRRYHALRREVDHLLDLVHQLNQTAVSLQQESSPTLQHHFLGIKTEMVASVERMTEVAGRIDTSVSVEPHAVDPAFCPDVLTSVTTESASH